MRKLHAVAGAIALVGAMGAAGMADASPKGCPPGLAKKAVPCVPPGQVNKGWDRGDRLPYGDYVLIPREDWLRLQLADLDDGTGYALVENQILRVALDTLRVIESIRRLDAALN